MSKAKDKGTRAETECVKYLRQRWPAVERRALAGSGDKGDLHGIPKTVGEVKAAVQLRLRKWQQETLEEMANAEADNCFLVIKVPYKNVSQWDFWIPAYQVGLEDMRWRDVKECRWLHMDFELGRDVLDRMIQAVGRY